MMQLLPKALFETFHKLPIVGELISEHRKTTAKKRSKLVAKLELVRAERETVLRT